MVGVPGLEPGTSPLSGVHSNQLSYTPVVVLFPFLCVKSSFSLRHVPNCTLLITKKLFLDKRKNTSQRIVVLYIKEHHDLYQPNISCITTKQILVLSIVDDTL